MGYDNDECVFCYLKGNGNETVDENVSCCFSCIASVSEGGAPGRMTSGLNQLGAFANIDWCEVCGVKGERLGLCIPICNDCCNSGYKVSSDKLILPKNLESLSEMWKNCPDLYWEIVAFLNERWDVDLTLGGRYVSQIVRSMVECTRECMLILSLENLEFQGPFYCDDEFEVMDAYHIMRAGKEFVCLRIGIMQLV